MAEMQFRSVVITVILLLMWMVPIPSALVAWRSWQPSSQLEWWSLALFITFYTLYLHLALNWAQTSVYLRPVLWLLLVITLLSGTRLALLKGAHPTGWFYVLLFLVLFVFLPATLRAWLGRQAPPNVISLGPVLAGGAFYVDQGGSREVINYHMKYPPLRYAVDFIGVGPWGHHARGFRPSAPNHYAIFGASVLAPCDAVVEFVSDGLPDLPVPQTYAQHLTGNVVILKFVRANQDIKVVVAHLKQGSIRVHVGERVRAGQIIAQVGNSGNTTEPHLHLGVFRGPLGQGEGLAFTIDGQFPVKGMIFKQEMVQTYP